MTETEARKEAAQTGGKAYYDKFIGWYVLPPETQAGLERQLAKKPPSAPPPAPPPYAPEVPQPPPPPTPPPAPWPPITPPPPTAMPYPPETPQYNLPETAFGPMTLEMLVAFVENSMRAETQPYQDPETGEITTMPVYSDEDIANAINQIKESVAFGGFGPQTPYYGAAQEYYAQIYQTEQGFGPEQLTQAQQLDYQLAQQQLALQRELAMLPYQGLTADQRSRAEQDILQRQAELDLAQQQLKLREQEMWLPYEEVPAGQEAQLALQREQMMLPYQQMTVAQQAAVDLERQRYGAELAAQPRSWLEYAAYTGETPAIQPWMQPLMPQQYQQLGAGQPIPGYQGTAGMAGMPQLTTPSRQYQARMGPTGMGQYQGYQQARTGARPEETEFRLWSAAPPSGAGSRLGYAR